MINFVCAEACRGVDHDGQPRNCPGGTWCDCHHRPVRDIDKGENK